MGSTPALLKASPGPSPELSHPSGTSEHDPLVHGSHGPPEPRQLPDRQAGPLPGREPGDPGLGALRPAQLHRMRPAAHIASVTGNDLSLRRVGAFPYLGRPDGLELKR